VSFSMLLTMYAHFSAYPVEFAGSWTGLHADNQWSNYKYDTQKDISVLSMSANLLAALAALVE